MFDSLVLSGRKEMNDSRLNVIFFALAALIGISLFFVQPQLAIVLVLGLFFAIYMFIHPVHCFYLIILTIPLVDRVHFGPISFSANDMALMFAVVLAIYHYIGTDKTITLKTRIDLWMGILTLVFLLAGVFSASDRGMLPFFKFFEAVVVFYLTVYFIRAKETTGSIIIRLLLYTALFQAALGILQSLTGSFGSTFVSQRGYLGYLGLGSSTVWHGQGTMGSFNTLGNFLTSSFLLFLPMYYYWMKRKTWGKVMGATLFLGIITTYSRGSLLGLGAGLLFFVSQIQKTPKRSMLVLAGVILLFIVPAVIVLSGTSYVDTVDYAGRLKIWQAPLAAITSSWKSLWFGSGLYSYEVVAWPYIPADVPMDQYNLWFAHNFYLLTILELGIVGASLMFGFLINQFISAWRGIYQSHTFLRVYNSALGTSILSIFFVSIFDHSYNSPYFKMFLFLLLGVLYAKTHSNKPAEAW